MILSSTSWENHLLALACAPLNQKLSAVLINVDTDTLERAYLCCAQITAQHSKTFYLASSLLPLHKRRPVRALYAFCRVSDDLVDHTLDRDVASKLEAWRLRSLAVNLTAVDRPVANDLSSENLVALAWADTRAHYDIPMQYAHQLLDGVAQDIQKKRYDTFEQLSEYAYRVASTVGLMAMHIIGFDGAAAVPYAIKLGVALQLTNILRDIGEDWRRGRLYLPMDELARFGLSATDVAAGRIDDRWRDLMRFQIARTRQLYAEALPGVALLHPDGRFSIAAAAELYRAILSDIEQHDYDVFNRRAYVSRWGKLHRLPGIWWRSRRSYPSRAPLESCHD